MFKQLEKHRMLISLVLTALALTTLFLWPAYSRQVSMVILLTGISMAMAFIVRAHWKAYRQEECTREKMVRNLSLDLIGLLLTMAAAIFAGGAAGGWAGMQAGMWVGLLEGFAVGFLAAWVVRSAWGRLVRALA